MTEPSDKRPEQMFESKWISLFVQVYGPYTFSIVSLLIIWYAIVNPQMDAQAIDYKKNETIVENLRSISVIQDQTAKSMERTAIMLESLVERSNSGRP